MDRERVARWLEGVVADLEAARRACRSDEEAFAFRERLLTEIKLWGAQPMVRGMTVEGALLAPLRPRIEALFEAARAGEPRAAVAARLVVHLVATAQDEGEQPVADPTVLAAWDGARELSGIDLRTLAPLEREHAIVSGRAALSHDPRAGRLTCALTLDCSHKPTPDEVARVLRIVETELLFTPWGMNLEWEERSGTRATTILVDAEIVRHEVA